jgi:nicotinamide mononucleotide (NMN) deamidase PncC
VTSLKGSALLATPGASAYYVGGTVVHTAAARAWMADVVEPPAGMRGEVLEPS